MKKFLSISTVLIAISACTPNPEAPAEAPVPAADSAALRPRVEVVPPSAPEPPRTAPVPVPPAQTPAPVSAAAKPKERKVTTADNSSNTLDWEGIYIGMVPCGDCDGIETVLTLRKDRTYVLETVYRGRSEEVFRKQGNFTWSKDGNRVQLSGIGANEGPSWYAVGEGKVTQLGMDGERVEGKLAERYVFLKSDHRLFGRYWRLIELGGVRVSSKGSPARGEQHMVINALGGRVSGHGGCNAFSGTYEWDSPNRLRFGRIAATKMFCADFNGEAPYLEALGRADSYLIRNDTLQLLLGKMAPLARFAAVEGR